MPTFYFHFNDGKETFPSELGLDRRDLEQAYMDACAAVPDMARELLLKRQNPLEASFIIADAQGRKLMTIPFTEVLPPSEWRREKARVRPYGGPRSNSVRDDLALTSFRRMFEAANAGCVLLTPEMTIVEMNEFGARHSNVDADAIRGVSIFDIFDLHGEPKTNFYKFMSLAQSGVVSEVVDLPYLVQDAHGQTVNGWWNARTWQIFDDDKHLLGFVEWAEPFTAPTRGGKTRLLVGRS